MWLEKRYAPHHAPDIHAHPNFSLLFRTPENSSRYFRRHHTVYRGRCPLVRTRHAWRAVGALDQAVGRLDYRDPTLLATRQLVVTRGNHALLVPTSLLSRLETVEDRLNAREMMLADPPFADLDAREGTVVIDSAKLEVSPFSPTNPLDPNENSHAASRPVPGRYGISAWLMLVPDGNQASLPKVRALAAALTQLDEDDQPVQLRMEKTVDVLGRVSTEPVWYDKVDALVDRFDELL